MGKTEVMSEGKLFLIAIKNASEHANPFVRAAAVVARLIYKKPLSSTD